jgi:gamma-glutamyltranspeptidase/glutathione hydrolase
MTRGIVVCPQPRAADVGRDVLAGGGTAFDAAIAAAFAQMIVDPFMCGIGGMGTLQYFRAHDAAHGMIDFHTRAGARVTPDMWHGQGSGRSAISAYSLFDDYRSELGHTAIMTPGTVAGFVDAHRALCSRPLAELLAPAVRIAREGYPLPQHVRDFWTRTPMAGVPDGMTRLKATQACADIYLSPDGEFWKVGDLIRNPDYGDTLETIGRDGAESFYTGALAQRIAADLDANGAYVTAADLAAYRSRPGKPVLGSYRGFTVASNPPPGSGAILIQMLQILEHFDLGVLHHGSAEHIDLVARAMGFAHADRERWLADPEFVDVPVDTLLAPARAAEHAERIRAGERAGRRDDDPYSSTTHLSVYDEHGNAVSVTHTLGTGCGVVTPGLGFVWNNSMKLADPRPGRANSFAPGKARTTGMVPTLLLKDGKVRMVVGALGGSVIISAVLQTILNIVDFAMSPVEAVTVPRIHHEGGAIHAEARVQENVVRDLEALGHQVEHSPISFNPVMARAHAISIDETGRWRGGADPRSGAGISEVW